MLLPHSTSHFDEAADMFAYFDADHSGAPWVGVLVFAVCVV